MGSFKIGVIILLNSLSQICYADSKFDLQKEPQTMDVFLKELNDNKIKEVIGVRDHTKKYLTKVFNQLLAHEKSFAVVVFKSEGIETPKKASKISLNSEFLSDSLEILQECKDSISNSELNQKLCSLSFEKMMDQVLLDHGYSKFTSTIISNVTILEKQLFFTNDPNQEFVIVALPAISNYDGSSNFESIFYNGVYFVVYKKKF